MNNNTDISERILQMLEYLSVNKNNFAKILGYERSQMLYDILNCKSKPSYDFFYRFLNSDYSVLIDISWLITGKGSMLKNTNNITATESPHEMGECQKCKFKDQIIDTQSKHLKSLEKMIDVLEDRIQSLKKLCDDPEDCAKKGDMAG